MKPKASSTLAMVGDTAQRRLNKRLKRYRSDPDFAALIRDVKKRIKQGHDTDDIRKDLNLWDKDQKWADVLHVVRVSTMDPSTLAMEWHLRNRARYGLASNVYNSAKDNDEKLKAIFAMQKIDEQDIELFKLLGMIESQPIDDDGFGIPDSALEKAEEELRRKLNERVVSQLSSEPEKELPVALPLLSSTEPGREADQLEQVPVVEGTTS